MNDYDLSRAPSPYLLPAAMEFLKMLGVPQPPPQPVAPTTTTTRERPREEQRVEHALELLRQLSQELVRNPPTLHQAVASNPSAQGQIFRRALFVADEIEMPEPPVLFTPVRSKAQK